MGAKARVTGPELKAWLAYRKLTYQHFADHTQRSLRTIKRWCNEPGRLPIVVAHYMATMHVPGWDDGSREGIPDNRVR